MEIDGAVVAFAANTGNQARSQTMGAYLPLRIDQGARCPQLPRLHPHSVLATALRHVRGRAAFSHALEPTTAATCPVFRRGAISVVTLLSLVRRSGSTFGFTDGTGRRRIELV